jgi:hypothetical protein
VLPLVQRHKRIAEDVIDSPKRPHLDNEEY